MALVMGRTSLPVPKSWPTPQDNCGHDNGEPKQKSGKGIIALLNDLFLNDGWIFMAGKIRSAIGVLFAVLVAFAFLLRIANYPDDKDQNDDQDDNHPKTHISFP